VKPGDRMPRLRVRREVKTVQPEDEGRFVFGELAPSWSGKLVVSDFPFANGEFSLALDSPRPDLVLALHSGPAIVGRILDPSGQPAERIEGGFQRRLGSTPEALNDITTGSFQCRADGRFRIRIIDHYDSGSLTLRVESEGVGYLRLETPVFTPAAGLDLGDLQLEPVRAVAFTAHDPNGSPIEGAFARIDGLPWSQRGASTGADGKGSLTFAPDRSVDVRVSAPGFADRVQRVPLEESAEFVLEPLAVLDLQLAAPLAAQAAKVRLTSDRSAFVWDDHGDWDDVADVQVELGGIKFNERLGPKADGRREYSFQHQYDGHYHLVGLAPDVPVTVEVLDEQGRVLASDSVSVASQSTAKLALGDPNAPVPEPLKTKMPMRRSAAAPR